MQLKIPSSRTMAFFLAALLAFPASGFSQAPAAPEPPAETPAPPAKAPAPPLLGQIMDVHPVSENETTLKVHMKEGESEFTVTGDTLIQASTAASQLQPGDLIVMDSGSALNSVENALTNAISPETQAAAQAAPAAAQMPQQAEMPMNPAQQQGPPPPIPPTPKGPPDTKLPGERKTDQVQPGQAPPQGQMPPEAQQAAAAMAQQQGKDMMQQQAQQGGEQPQQDQRKGKDEAAWEKKVQNPDEYKDTLDLFEPPLKKEEGKEGEKKEEAGEAKPEEAAPVPHVMQVVSIEKNEETITLVIQSKDGKKESASFAAEEPVLRILTPKSLAAKMMVQLEVVPDSETKILKSIIVLS
ncbi:MAG TPA: hypothetical protein VL688_02115 [Verrucomicrobiae bacterium]|jgi:hypothetical protein|nr:hypothetical protein [Verrucomicrobiae bacterium]